MTYWKIPFEWSEGSSLSTESEDASVSWVSAEEDERFLGVLSGVLAESPDAADQRTVRAMGATQAAHHLLDCVPSWGFGYQPGWWQLLVIDDEVAGFILPVIYEGCARDGLDEATIFHMGVLPLQRSRGLGRILLRQATRTLINHGVWRIYCDTAMNNGPMIHLFESEGWTRLAPHERAI